MPMPAHLEAWWREHPERRSQRYRHYRGFPADGTQSEQIQWFQRQFLRLADMASTTKERGEFLRLAFMATLKAEASGASDDAAYREWRENLNRIAEEAAARFKAGQEAGAAINPASDRETETPELLSK